MNGLNDIPKDNMKAFFESLQETERHRTCGVDAAQRYQKIHTNRFRKTFEICKQLAPNPHIQVLDVGPSSLTTLLAQEYDHVSTLGLDITTDDGGQQDTSLIALHLPHISFELNYSPYTDRWPNVDHLYDLIVYAETLEHLSIAPEYSLVFLASLLTENGILLVTTPNAAMIMKRLILLLKGKNPFERIRLFSGNPGHYREYTMSEMIAIGKSCQFDVIYAKHNNFYAAGSWLQSLLKNLKQTFRDTLVVAYRNNHIQVPPINIKGL